VIDGPTARRLPPVEITDTDVEIALQKGAPFGAGVMVGIISCEKKNPHEP
jgi:hypothetical protein